MLNLTQVTYQDHVHYLYVEKWECHKKIDFFSDVFIGFEVHRYTDGVFNIYSSFEAQVPVTLPIYDHLVHSMSFLKIR